MAFTFDEDTTLRGGPEHFTVTPSPRWNIGRVPNGGYLLALMGRACLARSPHPDVLNATVYFLRPAGADEPAEIEVEALKEEGRSSGYSVRFVQQGLERARATFLCADLDALSGVTGHYADAPAIPPPSECYRVPPELPLVPAVMRQVEIRLAPDTSHFLMGARGDRPEHRGWLRFTDDRPVDALSLLLLADVLPPTCFHTHGMSKWVPTLELSVQVRARPSPGSPIGVEMVSRHFSEGHFEEDGTFWSDGRLVALTRQRALILKKG